MNILRILLIIGGLWSLLFVATNKLPAGFTTPNLETHIEINGIDYGPFDKIKGLEQFSLQGWPLEKNQSYAIIEVSREFVTDPSLYLWAKNRMSRKSSPQNIYLVKKDEDGKTTSQQVLELCQPLSWTVEATNPSIGGFNETINIAVQKISIY